jgi:hypothetical protein
VALATAALERAVRPVMPRHLAQTALRERLEPAHTVVMTCGNPSSMADIRLVAEAVGARYEKEDWKLVLPSKV